jgi:large subunit ribosomal protein L25
MKTITIEGQLRTGLGKSATRQLRSQGQVPAVIYGGAKEINFYAPAAAFKTLVYTHEFQQAEVKLNGESYRCIMKDLQFDKVSDALIHVDFLELVEGKKVIADIPLHFIGSAKGVKEGGRLYIKMKTLRVKTYPQYLKEHIDINVDDLELNQSVRVEDIKIDNYEMLNSPRVPVVSVSLTRQLKEEPVAAAAGAAPAEGAAAPAEATATAAGGEKEKEKEKEKK